jgi:hypothetical protein
MNPVALTLTIASRARQSGSGSFSRLLISTNQPNLSGRTIFEFWLICYSLTCAEYSLGMTAHFEK